MKTHAFVLHLVRATARRENAQVLLEDCRNVASLDGQIWPAVDGRSLSDRDLEKPLGAGLFDPPYPFALKTGEIGCFLSHRQIWAELQTHAADAALIIEDDAEIDPLPFLAALELAQKHIAHLGYIQFQTRPSKGAAHLIDTLGDAQLVVPQVSGLRTTAQMVSRPAARHLLSHSDRFDRPVDAFVQSHWQTGLRAAMVYPSGIRDIADTLDGSTIQTGKTSLFSKLGREVSRARYRSAVSRLSRQSAASVQGGVSHGG